MKNTNQMQAGMTVKTVTWTPNGSWGEVLLQPEEEDVIVLRDGHPFVLITPFDDDDLAWYARARPRVSRIAGESAPTGRTG